MQTNNNEDRDFLRHRVKLYSDRQSKGCDLFTGKPLPAAILAEKEQMKLQRELEEKAYEQRLKKARR
jgi:hypothetical protein